MADQEFESKTAMLQRDVAKKEVSTPRSASDALQREVVDKVTCRAGDASCAAAHAAVINRATDARPGRASQALLQLQRRYGNHFVEQVIARAHESTGPNEVHPAVEQAIDRQRGLGQPLDTAARGQMESSLGADFSSVRVHTGSEAHTLNHSLSAKAFTTGNDIFFREGAYQPGSFVGRELLAHELTHVVQQNGSQVSRAMSVSQPGDAHEREAERTAQAVMQRETDTVSRQPEAHHHEEDEEKKHHLATKRDPSGHSAGR